MFLVSKAYALSKRIPEDFGCRHLRFKFQNDPVDVIVISKSGEEKAPKPIFFFCQGSLPQPVIRYGEKGLYGILPFDENAFLDGFHIAIVGKPFIPVIADVNQLGKDFAYTKDIDSQLPPKAYRDRNYPDYYVYRNNFILKQLIRERWSNPKKLVVSGHGQGSGIAAKMAALNKKITHLIYSDGNPYGHIMDALVQSRLGETDSVSNAIDHWKFVVANCHSTQNNGGDSCKTAYDFSLPQRDNLIGLDIPVLMAYGTKDWSVCGNDLFQIEAIRERKQNFTFKMYDNLENNWDNVVPDWLDWLQANNASAK